MQLTITELQSFNVEILKVVAQICEEENIPYIGMFGTLLGAIRHRGTIPWDADVDIAVPITHLENFLGIMEEKLPYKYIVDYRINNKHKRLFPRIGLRGYDTKELHVDVYPIIGLPESINKQKELFFLIRKVVGLAGIKRYEYAGFRGLLTNIIRSSTSFITESSLCKWYDLLCNRYPYSKAITVGCSNAADGYKRVYKKIDIEDTILTDYSDFQIRIPANYDKILRILFNNYMEFPPEKERQEALNKIYIIKEV